MFIDSHAHLYSEEFDADRQAVIERALAAGVHKMFLPNCDLASIPRMLQLAAERPDCCFPMMGLHPCYVREDYKSVLAEMRTFFEKGTFYAVGEIGLDYYWDTTFITEQKDAFSLQIDWALALERPIVIHTRNSIKEGIALVKEKQNGNLKGVFHCFSGNLEEAQSIVDLGFYLGIGGVATFKNTHLKEFLGNIPLDRLLLETDAPYLAPVPYRGKRNESAYIPLIAQKIADIRACSLQEVAEQTTKNANCLFGCSHHGPGGTGVS